MDRTDALAPFAPPVIAVTAAILGGEERTLGASELVVGSGDVDLHVEDTAVSRRHVALSLQGAGVRLRDLGSTNGTWVGAYRVRDTLVPAGTVLRVGRTLVHLRSADAGGELSPSEADRFGELRGGSVAMRQLYAVLERVAPTSSTVLLDGETGSGKEVVARSIHAASSRRDGPLVVLDCSSVPADLAESQLFGHVRGAFTGAVEDRRGVFEAAGGGTLFLDELDSLAPALQARLLRALETRAVVRVGDHVPRPADVRVLAACGRSPEDLVADGRLRADLYFRLAVVRLTVPPLRNRLEDLPELCAHLLERLGRPCRIAPGPALDRLQAYGWPGNVRELRNVLERAVTLADPGATDLDALPLQLGVAGARPAAPVGRGLPYKEAKALAVEAWERAFLADAMARAGGNLSLAARAVGLSRTHLRARLKATGLYEG